MLQYFTVAHIAEDRKNTGQYLSYEGTGLQDGLNMSVLSQFCFPLGADSQIGKEYLAAEEYTFTLTGQEGNRLNGICRRFLPPKANVVRFPQVLCIVCEYSWFTLVFKVLEVIESLLVQQKLVNQYDLKELPHDSSAAQFLRSVNVQLSREPRPGQILRVPLPEMDEPLCILPCEKINYSTSPHADYEPLECTEEFIELQVPPECGNGKWNGGISLARACWHIPVGGLLTLIASLLLERRIIMVSQFRGTMSAAVHAASALIYPFQWQHIFIPVLPASLQDYLSAPMPFLIGMPAQLLPRLKRMNVQDVVIVDLDVSKVFPKTGSEQDDGMTLPRRKQLESALQAAISTLRNPSEFHANVIITGIMQEYFVSIFGSYRRFIRPQFQSMSKENDVDSEAIYGSDHWFDHDAFIASHKRLSHAETFMSHIRHSQLYEVFVQERLQLAANQYRTEDDFEKKVAREQERLKKRTLSGLVNRNQSPNSLSQWMMKESSGLIENFSYLFKGDKGHKKTVSMDSIVDDKHSWQRSPSPPVVQQLNDPSSFFEDDDPSDTHSEMIASSHGYGLDAFNPFRRRSITLTNEVVDRQKHIEMNEFGESFGRRQLETIPGSMIDMDPLVLAGTDSQRDGSQILNGSFRSQTNIPKPEIQQSIEDILVELDKGMKDRPDLVRRHNDSVEDNTGSCSDNEELLAFSPFRQNSNRNGSLTPQLQQKKKTNKEQGAIQMQVINRTQQHHQQSSKVQKSEDLFADLVTYQQREN
eukprot:TRINITY_DN2422_c0_g1_i8.p1 TRINITY_DN2422_c0_g1~~TRINITY_DN2422_c0_g1_i8.p1  ORF type:complete len:757 (-),score=106.08 TRINITY_DN2422_c0_g1_i8:540-2810(-)